MVRKIKLDEVAPKGASQYKDYYIVADPAGDGYNILSKDFEVEDEGYGSVEDAKKFIDILNESTLSISDLKAFYNTSDSIDKEQYPNFFIWYDEMVKSGKFRLGTKLFGESEVTNEKALTFDEFQEFAMNNYNSGGDSVVECWDEQTFNEYVNEFGPITKKVASSIFRMYNSVYDDIRGYTDLDESKSIKEDALDDSGVATAHVSALSERLPNSKFYIDSIKFILGKDLPDYFDTDEIISYSQFTDENNIRVTNSYKIIDRTRTDESKSTNEGYRYKGTDKTSSQLTIADLNALEANPGEVYNFNGYDIFYGENKDHFPFRPCYYVTYRPSNYTSIMTNKEHCLDYLNTYYKAKTTEDNKPLTEGKLYGTYDKTDLETDLLALSEVDKVDWDLSAYNELGEIIVLTHRAFEDSADLSTYYMKRTKLLREILKVFKKHNLKLEDPIEDQGTWWYFVLSEATPEVTDTPVFEHMVVEFFETSDPLTDSIMDKTKGVKYTDPKVLSDILVRADEAFRSQKDNIGYNKVYFDNYIRYQGKLYKFHAGRVDLGDGAAQVSIPDTYIKDVTSYFLDELKAGNDRIPVVEE